MYQKKQPMKTDADWDKIRFTNNLGPQIGGLLHDAVAIVVANIGKLKEGLNSNEIEQETKYWLNILYDIAEQKKAELTKISPVSTQEATQAGIDFNKRILADSKAEDLTYQQEATLEDQNKEMDKREDQQHKYGADNNGRQ